MKPASYVMLALLLLGAIPLLTFPLTFPFVALDNLMSLAGHRRYDQSASAIFFGYSFYVALFGYPVVYFVCVVVAIAKDKTSASTTAVWYAVGPLVYLLLLAVMRTIWEVRS